MMEFIQATIGIVVISFIFLLPFLFVVWFETLKQNDLQAYLAEELDMVYLPRAKHSRFEQKGYVEGTYHGHVLKFQIYNIGSGVDHWGNPIPVSNFSHFVIGVKTAACGKLEVRSLSPSCKNIVGRRSESAKVDYLGLGNNFSIVSDPEGFGLGILSDTNLLVFFSNQWVQILRVEAGKDELYLYLQRIISDPTLRPENFLPVFDFLVFVAAKHSSIPA